MNNALNYIINLNNGTFGRGITEAQNQVSKLDGMVSKIGVTIATTLSAHAALDLISEVTQLKAKFEGYDNVIRFASGSQVEYATNTKFLTDVIDGMNLPLEETTDAFAQWAGSIKGTTLEGELGRKVFLVYQPLEQPCTLVAKSFANIHGTFSNDGKRQSSSRRIKGTIR